MSQLDLADGLRLLDSVHTEGAFGHLEHLAFAWAVLDEADDVEDATRVVSMTIRHAAAIAGNPEKFHVTMTVFWIRVLDSVRKTHPGISTIEKAIAAVPELGDANLHRRHWSDINQGDARRTWVEPDLEPMP